MLSVLTKVIVVILTSTFIANSVICAAPDTTDSAVEQSFQGHVILIDVGHGGIDGGTSFQDILEKDINLDIAKRLYLQLRSQGYEAVLNRNEDYALSDDNHWLKSRSRHMRDLAQRKGLSEELKPSVVVSLHVNWGKRKNKGGPLVLHQDEGRSSLLAFSIQNALNGYYQTRTLPVVGKPFYLLNQIKAPSVIVEMGFLSNENDRIKMTKASGKTEIAQCIASGLSAYFSIQ